MEQNTPSSSVKAPAILGPNMLMQQSWALFKSNWKVFAGIAAVPSAISLLAQFLFVTLNPVFQIIGLFIAIISAILAVLMQAVLISAIKAPSGQISLRSEYEKAFAFFWSFLWIIVLHTLVTLGGAAILILPGIIISVYITFAMIVRINEGKKGLEALTGSFHLVNKRWWAVFGRLLYIGLISGVLAGLISLVGQMLAVSLGFSLGSDLGELTVMTVDLITAVILGPLTFIFIYRMYESLKANVLPEETIDTNLFFKIFAVIGILVIVALIISVFAISAYLPDMFLEV